MAGRYVAFKTNLAELQKWDAPIQPQFDWVDSFSYGLAAVRVNFGQYGYLDRPLCFAIEPQAYVEVSAFSELLAKVGFKNEVNLVGYGFIDRSGNAIATVPILAVEPLR